MSSKLKAAGLLFLMYGLGIATGLAWDTYFSHPKNRGMGFGERRISRLKKELQLHPWQDQALQDIVQDARERAQDVREARAFDMAEIREDTFDAIQQMLLPDQEQQFEKLHERWAARHHKGRFSKPGSSPDKEQPTGATS